MLGWTRLGVIQKLGENLICPAVTCLLVALTDQFFHALYLWGRGEAQDRGVTCSRPER